MGLSALIPQLTWQRRMKKNEERLIILRDLMESGKLTPIIERTYPLAEAGEAISHLQRGNVRGKIVLVM
jgi:NADPH:quinone reductase-like Zn-dependent oxidoreductase